MFVSASYRLSNVPLEKLRAKRVPTCCLGLLDLAMYSARSWIAWGSSSAEGAFKRQSWHNAHMKGKVQGLFIATSVEAASRAANAAPKKLAIGRKY